MRTLATTTVVLLLALAATPAVAIKVMPTEMTCPIGGHTFTSMIALSGSQMGENLDRRPTGSILAPWPIAKCPENGFVIFKENFTASEKDRLRQYVLSDEYQRLQKKATNYYLAAQLLKCLGAPNIEVAEAMLRATWEVDHDERYPRYASEALAAFEDFLSKPPTGTDVYTVASYEQIAAELERRLGRFGQAKTRVGKLLESPAVKGSDLEPLLHQEMALINAGDSRTHQVETGNAK